MLDGGADGQHGHGMHLELSTLDAGLAGIAAAPADAGTVELIVRRPAEGEREILTEARLDTALGLVGDRWLNPDADPERQITVMNVRVVDLVAVSRERRPLAGDQLYVDLDISTANLPAGTRLGIGAAVLAGTQPPHPGGKKVGAPPGPDPPRRGP